MSKVCKKCGYEMMDDSLQVCPDCGCSQENESASESVDEDVDESVDEDVLNKGKSTKAESVITDIAETILKWGNILSIVVPALVVIMALVSAQSLGDDGGGFTVFVSFVMAAVYFFAIRLLAKTIWALIMLFVNISTTLKRIEIKLGKETQEEEL